MGEIIHLERDMEDDNEIQEEQDRLTKITKVRMYISICMYICVY